MDDLFNKMIAQFNEDLEKENITDVIFIWASKEKPGMSTAFQGDVFKIMGWMDYTRFDIQYQLKMKNVQQNRPVIITPPKGGIRQ